VAGNETKERFQVMRSAVLYEVAQFRIEEVPSRAPGVGEVQIAVEGCGICGSDLHMYRGEHPALKPPLVMGHELVGLVTAVGATVVDFNVGDRVVAMAAQGCGQCDRCLSGNWNQCESLCVIGGQYPGGLSDQVLLPADQVLRIPDGIPLREAVLIEVAAVCMHATRRFGQVRGSSFLILGAGPVGLVLARVLFALGAAHVVLSDVSPGRRRLAGSLSVGEVLNLNETADLTKLRLAHAAGFDGAFDCAGRQATLNQALELTRRGGKVVLVAIFAGDYTVPMLSVQRGERSIVGVQLYQKSDFEEVIALIEAQALSLAGIVTHEFSLSEVATAFDLLLDGTSAAGKVLITGSGSK
jgi:2-desacetyl-2-hydroxyethyl bacteriochlorophyllide A dehydrogenase